MTDAEIAYLLRECARVVAHDFLDPRATETRQRELRELAYRCLDAADELAHRHNSDSP